MHHHVGAQHSGDGALEIDLNGEALPAAWIDPEEERVFIVAEADLVDESAMAQAAMARTGEIAAGAVPLVEGRVATVDFRRDQRGRRIVEARMRDLRDRPVERGGRQLAADGV